MNCHHIFIFCDCFLEVTNEVTPTNSGKVASYYYLQYETMALFQNALMRDTPLADLIRYKTIFFFILEERRTIFYKKKTGNYPYFACEVGLSSCLLFCVPTGNSPFFFFVRKRLTGILTEKNENFS